MLVSLSGLTAFKAAKLVEKRPDEVTREKPSHWLVRPDHDDMS